MFIDAFKVLLDAQTLVARLEDHVGLSGKHPAYRNVETHGKRNNRHRLLSKRVDEETPGDG